MSAEEPSDVHISVRPVQRTQRKVISRDTSLVLELYRLERFEILSQPRLFVVIGPLTGGG